MGVVLPAVFSPDGIFPDYEALLGVLLALVDPRLPAETRITEYWDVVGRRVHVRLTLMQAFRYTVSFDMHARQVDVAGVLDGLNGMLVLIEEPGRFEIDPRSLEVNYVVRGGG